MKCKICTVCGSVNDEKDLICLTCMSSIGEIEITNCNQNIKIEIKQKIFEVENQDIFGREAKGAEVLKDELTTSRKHIQFIFDKTWMIIDLNSTNGTYLNDEKITPNQRYPIKSGDIIKISSKVEIKVKDE